MVKSPNFEEFLFKAVFQRKKMKKVNLQFFLENIQFYDNPSVHNHTEDHLQYMKMNSEGFYWVPMAVCGVAKIQEKFFYETDTKFDKKIFQSFT